MVVNIITVKFTLKIFKNTDKLNRPDVSTSQMGYYFNIFTESIHGNWLIKI